MALSPISETVPWKIFLGNGVDGYFGGLAQMHVHNVSLIHFHFRGNHRHIGERQQSAARAHFECR